MNKTELIHEAANLAGASQKDTGKILDAVLETISAGLEHGESVQIAGFGTFEARIRSARTYRNPATGEMIHKDAAKAPAFKPGKALKERVMD